MSYVKLAIPPGVWRNGTEYQAMGRWHDSNMIRFWSGTISPVGGWQYVTTGAILDGPGRGVAAWRTNASAKQAAMGTPNKLWAFNGDEFADITPTSFPAGNVDTIPTAGYGAGDYSDGVYGSSTGGLSAATTWALDHFGESLLACASHDRTIYRWDLNVATKAAALSGAPTANSVFVTNERFVVAVGAGTNPRVVQWSDQEDATTWTPTATNQAGDITLQTNGTALRGLRVRGQNIILTSTDLWTMRYIGPQLVYSFELVAEKCGLVGPNAVVAADGGAYWMGTGGFYWFDGTRVQQLPCEVFDYVFADLNLDERSKICCGLNSTFNEVTWWWCGEGSSTITKGCTYNYAERHWTVHRTPYLRSCWTDADVFDWPIALSESGRVYYQEKGWTANGTPRTSQVFLLSGPVEVGGGDQTYMIRQVLPDEVTPGAWTARFGARFTPEGAETLSPTLPLTPYTDVRLTGRQMTVQLESAVDMDSRVGTFRVDGVAGSGR